ncbi:hypothetical protein HDU67_008079 [Dinochytrium kinnereticum]|nr:hypothetical protein HDU67_008079 [Dinochytrium kinnereticum]
MAVRVGDFREGLDGFSLGGGCKAREDIHLSAYLHSQGVRPYVIRPGYESAIARIPSTLLSKKYYHSHTHASRRRSDPIPCLAQETEEFSEIFRTKDDAGDPFKTVEVLPLNPMVVEDGWDEEGEDGDNESWVVRGVGEEIVKAVPPMTEEPAATTVPTTVTSADARPPPSELGRPIGIAVVVVILALLAVLVGYGLYKRHLKKKAEKEKKKEEEDVEAAIAESLKEVPIAPSAAKTTEAIKEDDFKEVQGEAAKDESPKGVAKEEAPAEAVTAKEVIVEEAAKEEAATEEIAKEVKAEAGAATDAPKA